MYQQGEVQQPTFMLNEEFKDLDVLRLSYHDRSHYNALYDPNNPGPVGEMDEDMRRKCGIY